MIYFKRDLCCVQQGLQRFLQSLKLSIQVLNVRT